MDEANLIIGREDPILITGSNGFIGSRVVATLLDLGFTNLRCFVRGSGKPANLNAAVQGVPGGQVKVVQGNLISQEDCLHAAKDAAVIFHLAARSDGTFAGSIMNCVVTTRNLLEAARRSGSLRRFVNVSSFAVYSNWNLGRRALLDEDCQIEAHAVERAEAYAFAKLKQDQLVLEYARKYRLPYVIVRPGAVYGP